MGANSGSLSNLKKIGTDNKDVARLQENVQNAIEPIISKALIDGVLLKNVCLDPGVATEVKHGLGRAPLGWIIVRKREDARVWDVQDFNRNPSRTLSLVASHSVELDIWIF